MSRKTAQQLSWGVVVATYQREKILPTCLKLAATQTRTPLEIIVVDSSDNWQTTHDLVMAELAANHPEIRWVYVAAEQRSSALQRNQGISLATADVLFLLDDDSFMYPDCAEQIMQIYEADRGSKVQGIQAALADRSPTAAPLDDVQKVTGWSNSQIPQSSKLKNWLLKHLFLMNVDVLTIPYNQTFPQHELPAAVQAFNIYPVQILHGCRMTFRRAALAVELFEPLLLYYAMCEDMDLSYRVSRHGALLEAVEAKLYHFHSGSGRLSRYQVSALSSLNQALFLKKNSDNLSRDQRRFYLLTARRILAEFLKDSLSRRWTLPQMRGLFIAIRYAVPLFALSPQKLETWYPELQRRILKSDR
ncbi:MAG: glycosyltransferase family 2 protein [Elainella sp.]